VSKLPVPLKGPVRAVQYLRMSAEHQRYSLLNQGETIREYANEHDMKIVDTYADAGKSGVSIRKRLELQRLLSDARNGRLNGSVILVLDVSRWGRFQDSDEAGYYEFICRRSGYDVIYCAESFSRDEGPLAGVHKSLKRAMAGEFSRELSTKVFIGQRRRAREGLCVGGNIGFGLRRAILGPDGTPIRVLELGQRKYVNTDRTMLVAGPAHEVEAVKRVFSMFVDERREEHEIAAILNSEREPLDGERVWSGRSVNYVLRHERYVGNLLWNRTSQKLHGPRVRNPRAIWVRVEDAFVAIVDNAQFQGAQLILAGRTRQLTDDDMLAKLRALLQEKGRLSTPLIDKSRNLPSAWAYTNRFGTLERAYALIGYQTERPHPTSAGIATALRHRELIAVDITRRLEALDARVQQSDDARLMIINRSIKVGIIALLKNHGARREAFWLVQPTRQPQADFLVIARIDQELDLVHDYFILPATRLTAGHHKRLSLTRKSSIHAYRCDTLDGLERIVDHVGPPIEDEIEGAELC
jgi:DNA invertase Pin-like site-specific DNA recombinase